MKYSTWLLFLLLCANFCNAQSFRELTYTNGEIEIAKLTVGNDCFRLESFDSIIKAQGDQVAYRYRIDANGKYCAIATNIENFSGTLLFQQDINRHYLKIDTTYAEEDSVINNLRCKKVIISYVDSILNEQNIVVPFDTLHSFLFVAPLINAHTPFSFSSKKLQGLIIENVTEHAELSVNMDKLIKTIRRNRIFTQIKTPYNLTMDFFILPKDCTYFKNQKKFDENFPFPLSDEY